MQLSAPIYNLKRKAKLLARETALSLHHALDKIATEEGFQSWSHLSSVATHASPAEAILSQFKPGDLCLLGARPRQGKTLLGLELASKALKIGRKGYFFTLDYHEQDIIDRFSFIGVNPKPTHETIVVDTSDDISADYIISVLEAKSEPALIVVDYLQLLDQKRTNPSLEKQINSLQKYAISAGAIFTVISQIDRSFDLSGKPMPDVSDVRLPNPLDLSVFCKFFFLNSGRIQLSQSA